MAPGHGAATGARPERRFLALEHVLEHFLGDIFTGHDVQGSGVFRVVRDSDIEIEEEAEDLVREFQTLLKQRRQGDVVRLKIQSSMPADMRSFIGEKLKADPHDVIIADGMLGLTQLSELILDDRPDLKFPAFDPRFPERIRDHGGDCFAAIRAKDILVHHPFERRVETYGVTPHRPAQRAAHRGRPGPGFLRRGGRS